MKFSLEMVDDVKRLINELTVGLNNLSLLDNFGGFEVTNLKLDAGETKRIDNVLRQHIPSKYVITKQRGNGLVTLPQINEDQSNLWSNESVFLTNNGDEEVTIDVIFMR